MIVRVLIIILFLVFVMGGIAQTSFVSQRGGNFYQNGKGQLFWKPGDEPMGDPPMEEQGLNTVFDTDRTTWKILQKTAKRIK